MKPSSIFNQTKSPSSLSPSSLSIEDLERFRIMMLGDKVIIGCDEVIEMYEDEQGLLECLVYLWQQNSGKFRRNLPLEIREWFLSKFVESSKDLVFYKGMHFKREDVPNGIDLNNLTNDIAYITSTTTDYDMAKDFAFGFKNSWLEADHICCIYRITGESIFDVKPYRDFGEEEFIVYKPKFELLEILN